MQAELAALTRRGVRNRSDLVGLDLPGAEVWLCRGWMPADAADALFERACAKLPWTQHVVSLFGKRLPAPRLSCWVGDAGARYRYSGTTYDPLPWPSWLRAARSAVEAACATPFNSVLLNRYRHGRDSMGWHADDEPELGTHPAIASLNLGDTRTFRFRPRGGGAGTSLKLGHGDLLLMRGSTQLLYQHCVPKTKRECSSRLNLTFRRIVVGRAAD